MRRLGRVMGAIALLVVVAAIGFVAFVQLTWRRDYSQTPFPTVKASREPEVIARGAYVARAIAHCAACHSPDRSALDDLSGGPTIDAGPFGKFTAPNLTPDEETGIGSRSDAELARTIRSAVAHDGTIAPMMLIGAAPMADEDLTSVVSYLRSLPPKRSATTRDEWGFVAKALASKFLPRDAKAPPYVKEGNVSAARGEYLVMGPALCVGCHTARDPMKGFAAVGPPLAGEPHPHADKSDAKYEIVAPNITPGGVLASVSEDAFVARFRAGRVYEGSIMPWESFKELTDSDLRSIYRYLRSVPAVATGVGPIRRAR